MKSILSFLGVAIVIAACSGGNVSVGGDGDSGTAQDSATADSSVAPDGSVADGSVTDGAAGDAGESCKDTPIARLCVRGDQTGGSGESLTAGGTVRFQVFPSGCHSSSCTTIVEASCVVQKNEGTVVTLGGKFCLGRNNLPGCTADCSGGGVGSCATAAVAAGKYTAKLGNIEVAFEVPSTLPFGGTCVTTN